MAGHIRSRGARSWELKCDAGADSLTGKRKTRYHNFKGTKRDAEIELAKLITSAANGGYVDPSKISVAEFIDRWVSDWARGHLSPKTLERYKELLNAHVRPHLGSKKLQKIKPCDLASFYSELTQSGRIGRSGPNAGAGLAPVTVAYIHRILHRAFGHAVTWGLIAFNPAASVEPPRAQRKEISILTADQVRDVLTKLRGCSMYLLAAVGLATGMRRGELLALRWKDVDLDNQKLTISRSLEQTNSGLRFKSPKTKHGRRSISVAPSIVAELRAHRRAQAELRLALGLGKDADDALVFRRPDGEPLKPNSVSTEWRRLVKKLKLPSVSLHAWRHTHASQLIASGMDILRISRRMGHSSPSITLDIYGHLFDVNDEQASAVFEDAFGGTLTEQK